MNNTATKESPFTRISGGLSVRKVIKAQEVRQTPEQIAKRHSVGLLKALIELYPKEAVEHVRAVVLDVAK